MRPSPITSLIVDVLTGLWPKCQSQALQAQSSSHHEECKKGAAGASQAFYFCLIIIEYPLFQGNSKLGEI